MATMNFCGDHSGAAAFWMSDSSSESLFNVISETVIAQWHGKVDGSSDRVNFITAEVCCE